MIRAMIVDDDPNCSEYLEMILRKNEQVKICGVYNSGQDILEALSGMEIDVAFLDIDMPELDGLTLTDMILDRYPHISVVFVTAYNKYAVEAFELNALDYILKPVTRDRVNESINRLSKEKKLISQKADIVVHCFGEFCVSSSESKETVKWQTSKSEELFAYLISHWGKDVQIEDINTDVFPDMNEEKAYNNIKTTIYKIKKTLSAFGTGPVITNVRGAYKLNPDTILCDYLSLMNMTQNPYQVNDESLSCFEKILSSYKGGFLENKCYIWTEGLRRVLEEEFIQMALAVGEYYRSVKNYKGAEKLLKKAVKISPTNYPINKALIETYVDMNDKIYALKAFDSYKRRLKEDFGEMPSKELSRILY